MPEGFVPRQVKRRRELRRLCLLTDTKATHWHRTWMKGRSEYARGMADAYSEVFHALSLMNGYPWA
jgi:hypothetical protein